jgi:hypothetical protein
VVDAERQRRGATSGTAACMMDTKPSREEAELYAIAESEKFHHHDYNAEGDYWWGREKDGHEVHRFVVRPATP